MSNRTHPPSPHWQRLAWYGGLDWGRKAHHVVVVDPRGQIRLDRPVPHDAPEWRRLGQALTKLAGEDLSVVGVAIETNSGPAVEQLVMLGCVVFPLQPKAAARYRDRKAPSGVKDDALDAWAFGDALRTDGRIWRAMDPDDPATQQLRLLCRDEVGLIEARTALVNQLQQALHEYYPAALEAFDDWIAPSSWAFVRRWPTPDKLARAGKRRWEKFLHTRRLARPGKYEHRMEVFAHATDLAGPPAVAGAKSRLAVSLVQQLQCLQKQIDGYRREIEQQFDQHPSREVFDSLPGAGAHLAPRLLSECATAPARFDDAQGLQCYAGTAPVQYQSGQICRVRLRRACNKHLRTAVHLWAQCSRRECVWAETYYQRKRQQGKSHACALRCLGQRWLKILWRMIQTGCPYNEALHTKNQVAHGSWTLELHPEPAPTALC